MREHGFMHYLETSAKSGQNVNELFQTITKHLFITHEANLDKFVSPSFHWPDERKQKDEDDQTDTFVSTYDYEDNTDDISEDEKEIWHNCDATLPDGWRFTDRDNKRLYRSPCGQILESREKIIDFMLGKGIEICHPTGYQSITPTSIDCDGLCEGSCDYFKIFRRYYNKFDMNKIRKTTDIKFVVDAQTSFIKDSLVKISNKQDNDVKVKTYFPAVEKGERPWIICIKDKDEIPQEGVSMLKISSTYSSSIEVKEEPTEKKYFAKKRRTSTSSECSEKPVKKRFRVSSSSRESTPTRSNSRSKQAKGKKKRVEEIKEYEGIYVQCCKKSCKKWRLVTQYEDASNVPEYWICPMNRDRSNNVCGVGGNEFNADSDKIDIKFSCGSLVWAKLKGFPWWPGMIDNCPDSDDYFWVDENISEYEPTWYHVVYFEGKGSEVTRAWIKTDNIVSMTTPITQPKGKTVSKPGPLKQRLQNAIRMAENAKSLNRRERLKKS